MSQQIIIAEQARIAALLTDDRVDELIVAQGQYQIGVDSSMFQILVH